LNGGSKATWSIRKLLPGFLKARLRSLGDAATSEIIATAGFQHLAYRAYQRGASAYVLPPHEPQSTGRRQEDLPIPPAHLWVGPNYEVSKPLVDKMLEIVESSGFTFSDGSRILDFGCGAARLTRHLLHLSDRCQIWGTDISAEHIFWCDRNLSPPFNFATTTKVPHLPFEDRSFDLIFAGSVFTHIDDLADAWLLELHRILKPEGRLYITIHDERTIEILEQPRFHEVPWLKRIWSAPVFQENKDDFGMMAIGRDDRSFVYYRRDFFSRKVSRIFDILAIEPEAFNLQTAFLLRRKLEARPSP
jgi:SAM-dependent methyltransferase